MKLLLSIIGLFISIVSFAQPRAFTKKDYHINESIRRLATELNLSKEQIAKLKIIEEDCVDKLIALDTAKPGTEGASNQWNSVVLEREAKLKQLLTSEQYNKYLEMKKSVIEDMKKQRKKHFGERESKS